MNISAIPIPDHFQRLSRAVQVARIDARPQPTINHTLTYTTELILRYGYMYASVVQWHPATAILATDDQWWYPDGTLLSPVDPRGRFGRWDGTGRYGAYLDWYHADGYSHSVTVCDLHTQQCWELADPAITHFLFHPVRPEVTILTTHGIYQWQIGAEAGTLLIDVVCNDYHQPAWSATGSHFSLMAPNGPGHRTCTVWVWDAMGVLLTTMSLPYSYMSSYFRLIMPFWHPTQPYFVTYHGNTLIWWTTAMAIETIQPLAESDGGIDQPLEWSPDGTSLLVVSDRQVILFDAVGTLVHRYQSPSGDGVQSITWHPSGQWFAAGYWDSTIVIWSLAGQVEQTIKTWHRPSGTGTPFMLRWDPTGTFFAAGLRSYLVNVYRATVADGEVIAP